MLSRKGKRRKRTNKGKKEEKAHRLVERRVAMCNPSKGARELAINAERSGAEYYR